ncbi:12540_t:CDS:1, partial [Racocetra persica]
MVIHFGFGGLRSNRHFLTFMLRIRSDVTFAGLRHRSFNTSKRFLGHG